MGSGISRGEPVKVARGAAVRRVLPGHRAEEVEWLGYL
jgi:hypothetical protein